MQLPESDILPVNCLERSLNSPTNSYKFYWFLAILNLLRRKPNNRKLDVEELALTIIALSWNTVVEKKVSLGKQDKLEELINEFKSDYEIDDGMSIEKLLGKLASILKEEKILKGSERIC